jgi:hypothetical protein
MNDEKIVAKNKQAAFHIYADLCEGKNSFKIKK